VSNKQASERALFIRSHDKHHNKLTVDAAVSAVGAAAELGSLVGLHVLDDQLIDLEVLGLSVGLGVLQQLEEKLGALLGPAAGNRAPDLALHPA
jgi:hypothetical protein